MRKAALLFIINSAIQHSSQAFQIGFDLFGSVASSAPNIIPPKSTATTTPPTQCIRSSFFRMASLSLSADGGNSEDDISSTTAESILDLFHTSNYPFRIVVIGNGAILETTSKLGPTSKSSISPKSGERLLTFASEDQSFEFHVKVEVRRLFFLHTIYLFTILSNEISLQCTMM